MQLNESIVIDKDVATGELYLVNLESGKLFRVNQTAEIIIDAIKEGFSVNRIEEIVCEKTNGDKEAIKRDISLFLDSMFEKGILEFEAFE